MIGLIDIDSKIANLALMKIKAFYGNKCEWFDGFSQYEKVYISKVFNFTKDYEYCINAKEIIKGGTGHNFDGLPYEVDICQPDYSIYMGCNYSLQRYTMGCIRNCNFCIVQKKEGKLKDIKPMNLNPNGKWIYLLDNNFFASENWLENIKHLQSYNQKVQFEGIDLRLLSPEMCKELNKIKVKRSLHTAWDDPKYDMIPIIKMMTSIIKSYKIMIYVLIGYNSTPDEDYYRVMKIHEFGCDPFVMPFNKKNHYQKRFARWVNHKAVFKSVKWSDYEK